MRALTCARSPRVIRKSTTTCRSSSRKPGCAALSGGHFLAQRGVRTGINSESNSNVIIMNRNCVSSSGFFNRRVGAALALCSLGVLLGLFSFASSPPSGTLTDTSGPLTYTAGPFFVANKTPIPEWDTGPECDNPFQPCDDYALTVTLPQGYAAAHPGASIKITLSWADGGSGQSDYDLYIYNNPDPDCSPSDCTVTDGTEPAAFQSAGGANPEVA